ncbi:enoyl-CoA hydratase-related protein [Novosphingobium mangrovi (ex Hu et al. 2023)]|uniref:Enoyl-CoA hydratase-related protein n=1 Tax=Novosphingobium mangrovi (ex Hu et al. 2023) TaxID=2930094 RepID=A0ABT0AEH2_9SPHN|nr:enoyl-CoA hydratase-related protein [Novosphingobium mangrovi (ex Hu et al. 2023)]MCJ1961596.1 enoyl-CoA hydratase-related protein [Novosphingobium mangrovi (ex Hu et al. 2023)]
MSLLREIDGNVLRLIIDRPEKRNAIDEPTMRALTREFAAIDHASPIRAVVLTGSGDKAFCSGADLGGEAASFGPQHHRPTTVYADLLRAAARLPVPLIARVQGWCLAGGMGLLAMSDMAVASHTARFGLPEVKVGLFPMQVAALLQSLIPRRRFAEMCFTGEPISADEALAIDLVNYVVEPEELDAKVDWLLARLVDKSPTAIRLGKHALRAIADMSVEQALAHMEGQVALIPLTQDAAEGLAAFREKRAPVWTGK